MPDRVLSSDELREVLRLLVRVLGVTSADTRRRPQQTYGRPPVVLPPAGPCRHYIGASDSYCGADQTRRYVGGPRCAVHSPAASR